MTLPRTLAARPGPRTDRVVYRCPECGQRWTVLDDPDEWAYGHDCEVED